MKKKQCIGVMPSDTMVNDALEAGEIALFVLDADGQILQANPQASELLRVPHETMPELSFIDRLLPAELIRFNAELQGAAEFVAAFRKEAKRAAPAEGWSLMQSDGMLAPVHLFFRLPPDHVDSVVRLLVYCRKDASRGDFSGSIIERRSRFSAFLEAAVDGIVICSSTGEILTTNAAAANIFGYEEDELVGEKVEILMPEPYNSLHGGFIRRYLRTGVGRVIGQEAREVEGVRKDGSSVPLELSVAAVQDDDETVFMGMLRDISKRRKKEQQLRWAHTKLMVNQNIINDDLHAAEAIQKSLLPADLAGVSGVEVDWHFKPSARVGGDIFNIVPLDGNGFALYVLDVSGHGVSSSLVAITVWQALAHGSRLLVHRDGRPRNAEQVVQRLEALFPVERFNKFFSLFYMTYNPATCELHYCNAGHPSPLLLRRNGQMEYLDEGGTVIGLGGVLPFTEKTIRMEKDDLLLLYTDGYSEHEDKSGQPFGQTGIQTAMVNAGDRYVDNILDTVDGAFENHAPGKIPQDDLTMVCLRFLGPMAREDER